MKLHDPFTRLSRDTARRFRLRGPRLGRPHRTRRPAPGTALSARVRERERRGLAALDHCLTAEEPRLASLYGVFNELVRAEGPVSGERLPVPPPRRGPGPLDLALLAGLSLLAFLCFALSPHLRPAVNQCRSAAANSSVSTSTA